MAIAQYKKEKEDWYERLSDKGCGDLVVDGMKNKYLKPIEENIKKDASIIIFGAGWGRYVQVLRNRGFVDVSGIEINEKLIELGRKRGIEGIIRGTILSTPFRDGQFDACLDFGTVEHFNFSDQKKIIEEAKRVTRPGGSIFIDVPYINSKRALLYPVMLTKNVVKRMMGYKFHQYIYRKQEARNILKNRGITVVCEQISNSGCRIGIMGKKAA